jgi:hypothetical protein
MKANVSVLRFLLSGYHVRLVVVGAVVALATAQSVGGYPDGHYPSPLNIGQWDHLQIGVFFPPGADQLRTKKYWGFRRTDAWADILVRGASGTSYVTANDLIEAHEGDPLTVGVTFSLRSSPNGAVPNTCHRAWTGQGTEQLTPTGEVRRTVVNGSGETEEVTFGAEHLAWQSPDPNYLQLQGTLVTHPGTNWLLPWRDPSGATDAMYYQVLLYKVDGRYCGEPVSGHVQIEHIWGTVPYLQTWWVQNRLGQWAIWSTEYADGTREHGQFLCGEYGERGAVIVNEKGEQVLNTQLVNLVDERQTKGRLLYKLGEDQEKWEFVVDPTLGLTGQVKRVGEGRKIVSSVGTYQLQKVCAPVLVHDRDKDNEDGHRDSD